MRQAAIILFAFAILALSACGGPINPDRPPLYDYEPPPIGTWPEQSRDPRHRV